MAIVIVNRDCKSTRIYNGHTIDLQIKKNIISRDIFSFAFDAVVGMLFDWQLR